MTEVHGKPWTCTCGCIDTPIPYIPAPEYTSPAPGVIDVPGAGIQFGDRFVQLIPASFELYCSCGHERYNVQLGDFPTAPDGSYIWDCPSCDTRIEFDGNDIHVAG